MPHDGIELSGNGLTPASSHGAGRPPAPCMFAVSGPGLGTRSSLFAAFRHLADVQRTSLGLREVKLLRLE